MTTPAYPEDSRIELLTCPYNKAHQIQRNRMQTHLIKCRKSYPEILKTVCPFNVTHLVKEPELAVSFDHRNAKHFLTIILQTVSCCIVPRPGFLGKI